MVRVTGPKRLATGKDENGVADDTQRRILETALLLNEGNMPGKFEWDIGDNPMDFLNWNDVRNLSREQGVDILDLEVWFEISDIDGPCPFANQTPVDGNGDPVPIRTWAQWGKGPNNSHAPVLLGVTWYRSNLRGASGTALKSSLWEKFTQASNQNGPEGIVLVHTRDEFRAIAEAEGV